MKSRRKLLYVVSLAMVVIFVMTPVSAAQSRYFSDVTEELAWASDAVDRLYEAYAIKGTGNGEFSPMDIIPRGDFMLMLVRAFGLKGTVAGNFSDVAAGIYYYDAISIARNLGIAKGSGENFSPAAGIARQDAMVLVYRAMEVAGIKNTNTNGGVLQNFEDASLVSDYAVEAVSTFVEAGVILGTKGKLNPKSTMSRAEMAVILDRVLQASGQVGEKDSFVRGVNSDVISALNLAEAQGEELCLMLEFVSRAMIENGFTTIDGSPSVETATSVVYDVANHQKLDGLSVDGERVVASNEQMGQMYQSVFALGNFDKDAGGLYLYDTELFGDKIRREGENIIFQRSAETGFTTQVEVYYGETTTTATKVWCEIYSAAEQSAQPEYYGYALVFLKSGDGWAGGYQIDSFELFKDKE